MKSNFNAFFYTVIFMLLTNGNCIAEDSGSRVGEQYSKISKTDLKEKLTPLQFHVTQEDGTEPPFNNEYWDNDLKGIYVDIITGEPLFSSLKKYKSGTGWPSFTDTISKGVVTTKPDNGFFVKRTEVRSAIGNNHLGHVFDDGPIKDGGKRYCMNSAALKFIPFNKLKENGYEKYMALFDEEKNTGKDQFATSKFQEIVLAGGCFWGMEELLRKEKGIEIIEVGYAGGDANQSSYEQVKTGRTGNAESVRIVYDPAVLNLNDLLEYFFKIHDPTTLNQQGNDMGTQYRSAIFTTNEEQAEVARQVIEKVEKSGVWKNKITTEIQPLENFVRAEEYHQDYLQKNPRGYTCHFERKIDF